MVLCVLVNVLVQLLSVRAKRSCKSGKVVKTVSIKSRDLRLAVLVLLALGACSNLSPTEQRVLSGGSIGSAIGIGISIATGGCIPCGGSIGSLLGSGAGYLYDQQAQDNDETGVKAPPAVQQPETDMPSPSLLE